MATFVTMIPYGNNSGRSGVVRYGFLKTDKLTQRVLIIEFKDGGIYAFMEDIVGKFILDQMIAYAEQGEGLASFIGKERPLGLKIEMAGDAFNGYFPSKR